LKAQSAEGPKLLKCNGHGHNGRGTRPRSCAVQCLRGSSCTVNRKPTSRPTRTPKPAGYAHSQGLLAVPSVCPLLAVIVTSIAIQAAIAEVLRT
jgi:hypothetical protein